jgi:hypothetical protein
MLRRARLIFLLLTMMTASRSFAQTPLASTYTVDVDVNTTWTDTGIVVAAGDSLIITAMGTMSDGAGDWNDSFGPQGMLQATGGGCTSCPLAGYPTGALIARIGTGSPFYVGDFLSVACQTGGVLYLGVNDNAPAGYQGTLRAFVWGDAVALTQCVIGPCAAASAMGNVYGDTGSQSVSHSASGPMWLRVYVAENHSGFCQPTPLRAAVRLTPPAGNDYDLHVYCDSCGGSIYSSTQPGSAVEEVFMLWDEEVSAGCPTGSDSSRWLYIRVDCTSTPTSDQWLLEVFGNTGAGPNTCGTQ